MTMALMAVNRFVRVCKPQKYNKFFNKKTSLIMIGACWIIVFTSVPLIIQQAKLVYPIFEPHKTWCGFGRSRKTLTFKILTNLIVILDILIPLTIIIYCYFKVFKKIREHKRNIAPSSNISSLGPSVQEIKVTWTLFAVLLGYCLNWFPVLIVVVVSNLTEVPRQAHMIVTYGMASSSAINPMIYGVMNPAFRREYKKIIKRQ
jgi:hypothetical protein